MTMLEENINDVLTLITRDKDALLNHLCGYNPERVIKNEYRNHPTNKDLEYLKKALYLDDYYRDNYKLPRFNGNWVFKKAVVHFMETMNNSFDKDILQNLYRNIETLKIRYYNVFNRPRDLSIRGYYDSLNRIYISDYYFQDTIFHELLHVASKKIKEDGTVCSGFQMYNKNINIGHYFDEGYTDILNERLFNKTISYSYPCLVASALEEIIGKETMEKYSKENNNK